ncbi:hypothetical protein TVAG_433830 [Trichomonas vaginalis G3]|uniref:Uncharacterized protein n=1 Tax=Trichomonas vaginalis (strain ATCC PRA-98 / G3) TaxID=412133 RepID=A2F7S8_TRIV3|nr:hypothetical protein TVAGG3_0247960 [Trichomonas vaginalis G3]EAX99055.1 hypothetical protein TVAG_433830 [Trichomonas vaginalis G3]KAI5553787.1 hypothetical protein TVAGG3_0247960 [Trichomonas vaginalis G3]|eukprot:XP_001311985.1 hypothetical protein [Trichomonas vaginalis G3]
MNADGRMKLIEFDIVISARFVTPSKALDSNDVGPSSSVTMLVISLISQAARTSALVTLPEPEINSVDPRT